MRVATFNIRYGTANDGVNAWPHRRAALLETLQRIDADVLCLQEVLDFQFTEIATALPDHDWTGVGRDDGDRAGEFAPILFRGAVPRNSGTFWLSETPDAAGSIAWGARLPRICTWIEFADLTIANLHLDHESKEARTRGIELVLSSLGPDLICGDFNATADEEGIENILAAGYVDVARDEGPTFNNFQPDLEGVRIDYVFALRPRRGEATVLREPLVSDHWPVIVDFPDHPTPGAGGFL